MGRCYDLFFVFHFERAQGIGVFEGSQLDFIVSVHGMSGDHAAIDVGGRDIELRDGICQELDQAGFPTAIVTTGAHAAINEANACNRGRRRSGAQLEITRSLRDTLTRDSENLRLLLFADAVRRALVL